jgi:hypothetical protein
MCTSNSMYGIGIGWILGLEDRTQACSIASFIIDEERAFILARDVDKEAIENDTTSSLARAANDDV